MKVDQLKSTVINAMKDHCTSNCNKRSDYFANLFNRLVETQTMVSRGMEALASCRELGLNVPSSLNPIGQKGMPFF